MASSEEELKAEIQKLEQELSAQEEGRLIPPNPDVLGGGLQEATPMSSLPTVGMAGPVAGNYLKEQFPVDAAAVIASNLVPGAGAVGLIGKGLRIAGRTGVAAGVGAAVKGVMNEMGLISGDQSSKDLMQKEALYQGLGQLGGDVVISPIVSKVSSIGRGVMERMGILSPKSVFGQPSSVLANRSVGGWGTQTPQDVMQKTSQSFGRKDINNALQEQGTNLTISQESTNPVSKLVGALSPESKPIRNIKNFLQPKANQEITRQTVQEYLNGSTPLTSVELGDAVREVVEGKLGTTGARSGGYTGLRDAIGHQKYQAIDDITQETLNQLYNPNSSPAVRQQVLQNFMVHSDTMKQSLIKRLSENKKYANLGVPQNETNALKTLIDQIPDNMTFSEAHEWHKRLLKLSSDFANDDIKVGKELTSYAGSLLDDEMKKTAQIVDRKIPGVLDQWMGARKFWKDTSGFLDIYESQLLTLAKEKPEQIAKSFIGKDGLKTAQDFRVLLSNPETGLMTQEGKYIWNQVRYKKMENIMKDAFTVNMEDPAMRSLPAASALKTSLDRMDPELMKLMYSPAEIESLQRLIKVLSATGTTSEGVLNSIVKAQPAVTALYGVSTGDIKKIGTAGMSFVGLIGSEMGLGRIAMNPTWSKALINVITSPATAGNIGNATSRAAMHQLKKALSVIQKEDENQSRIAKDEELRRKLSSEFKQVTGQSPD